MKHLRICHLRRLGYAMAQAEILVSFIYGEGFE
jgi:hypothetical protein